MEDFLRDTKECLAKLYVEETPVHVVSGNEACDLDSTVSALTFAFYLRQIGDKEAIYIPILNIQRSQYRLRTETTYFLNKNNITDDLLTFRDDIDLITLHRKGRLTLTLVDHNVLGPRDREMETSVRRIIDHRPQERQDSENVQITIDLVGSCSTLVAETLINDDSISLDQQIATLLLGTILVDTVNTSIEAGKTTPRDSAVIVQLKQMLTDVDCNKLYSSIQEAKNDVSALTTVEILEKDLKVLTEGQLTVAMASVPVNIMSLELRDGFMGDMEGFCQKHSSNLLVIMTMHVEEDGPHRELAVYSDNKHYREKMVSVLQNSKDPDLLLTSLSTNEDNYLKFTQGNVKASRKKVLPIVKQTMKESLHSLPQTDQFEDTLLDFGTQNDQPTSALLDIKPQINQTSDAMLDLSFPSSNPRVSNKNSNTNLLGNVDLLSPHGESELGPNTSQNSLSEFDIFSSSASVGDTGETNTDLLNFDFTSSALSSSASCDNKKTNTDMLNFDLLSDVNSVAPNPCDTQHTSQNVDLLSGLQTELNPSTVKIKLHISDSNEKGQEGIGSDNVDLLGDLTEADIMESPLRTPDIVVSGQHSTVSSGPSSAFPSVPVTPPNSYVIENLSKETYLPSFNSSEMVQKINEKKELFLGASLDEDNKEVNVPYTPQNSLMDTHFDQYAKDHGLPSFNSLDMVQRIQEKRSSLSGNVDVGAENNGVPFTPQNSLCENRFEDLIREHPLPSFNSSDMVQKIQSKRQSLNEESSESNQDVLGAINIPSNFTPFTPQNSFIDSSMNINNDKTVNASLLHKRLSEVDIFTEAANTADTVKGGNTLDTELEVCAQQNVVAMGIAQEMQVENSAEVENLLGLDFSDKDDPDDADKHEQKTNIQDPFNLHANLSTSNQESTNLNLNSFTSNQITEAANEAAIEEVSVAFTQELLQGVLEGINKPAPDNDQTNETLIQSPDSQNLVEQADTKEFKKVPSSSGMTVETDYLPKMDPLHGNLDFIAGNDTEIVESSSFRKISGEETLAVCSTKEDKLLDPVNESYGSSAQAVNSFAENLSGELMENVISEVKLVSAVDEQSHSNEEEPNHGEKSYLNEEVEPEHGSDHSMSKSQCESEQTSSLYAEQLAAQTLNEAVQDAKQHETTTQNVRNIDRKLLRKDTGSDISSEELVSIEEMISDSSDDEILTPSENAPKVPVPLDAGLLKEGISSSPLDSCSEKDMELSNDEIIEVCKEGENIERMNIGTSYDLNGCVTPLPDVSSGEIRSDISSGGISSPLTNEDLLIKDESVQSLNSSTSSSEISSTSTEGSYKVIQTPDLPLDEDVLSEEVLESQNGNGVQFVNQISKSAEKMRLESVLKSKKRLNVSKHLSISSESMTSDSEAKGDLTPLEDLAGVGDNNSEESTTTSSNGSDKKVISILPEALAFDEEDDRMRSESENSISDKNDVKEVQKEYFNTTAGRISILCDSNTGVEEASHKIEDDSAGQVGKMIARTNGLIAQVDIVLALSPDISSHCMESSSQSSSDVGIVKLGKTQKDVMNNKAHVSKEKLQGVEYSEEWQDDDVPGMPPAQHESDSTESDDSRSRHSSNSSTSSTDRKAVRPNSLGDGKQRRKIAANLSILTDDVDDDIFDPTGELEWENDTPVKCPIEPLPEFTAQEEFRESKLWKGVEIGGKHFKIDLKVIEPYKKVLSHGGYYGDGLNAIIIFSGCYLPDRGRKDYQYVMDNLFMYVISTLETLVAEDYMIVYFHGATPRRQMPSFGWLKRCYQMIDRRLRKNLKSLMLVHPTLWLRTIVMMTRPFISSKFSSKLRFVRSLKELAQILPMEYIFVPDQVQQYDDKLAQHSSNASTTSQSPHTLPSPS